MDEEFFQECLAGSNDDPKIKSVKIKISKNGDTSGGHLFSVVVDIKSADLSKLKRRALKNIGISTYKEEDT